MIRSLFDVTLLVVVALFIYQATQTKPESYDVMGPALWPMGVSIFAAALLSLSTLIDRRQLVDKPKLTLRFYLFIACIFGCVIILSWAVVPFFIPAAVLCFTSYLLLQRDYKIVAAVIAAASALVFCFALQWIFTTVVSLDLPTTFVVRD